MTRPRPVGPRALEPSGCTDTEVCLLVGGYAMLAGTLNSLGVRIEDGYRVPEWAAD